MIPDGIDINNEDVFYALMLKNTFSPMMWNAIQNMHKELFYTDNKRFNARNRRDVKKYIDKLTKKTEGMSNDDRIKIIGLTSYLIAVITCFGRHSQVDK